jgi:RND family efflux transporter MFP subunit
MNDSSQPPAELGVDPRVRRYALIALGCALLLALWGIVTRLNARSVLEREAAQAAVATVVTVQPKAGPGSSELVLPGTVQAFYEAPIYARTSGYLKAWYTDIGANVKKGQLLAEIDTPEVDQQLRQAQADLATAEANAALARTTNERWKGLLATQSVSQQDADERAGDAAAKAAVRQSAAANVARLQELESFKRVSAPFDGVVTQRNTDVGALINAGQGAPANALFRVADTHRLRIYVSVPQSYAAAISEGLATKLEFADHPGQLYDATVASSARALDANSRTLQVELQIDNTRGQLLPGSYAQVHFNLPAARGTLRIPVNTVLFRAAGLQVAVVEGEHVHLKHITQGRDFGTEIEVLAGLEPGDVLVLNPPDSIVEGSQVRIAKPLEAVQGKQPS